MGNTFFCTKCDTKKFEMSRPCNKAQTGKNNEKQMSPEEQWRLKLQSLDDLHSKQKGLTEAAFYELLGKLEEHFDKEMLVHCKNRDLIAECLTKYPDHTLNCEKQVKDFIECVDTIRIKKICQMVRRHNEDKHNLTV